MLLIIELLVEFYDILFANSQFLTQSSRDRLPVLGQMLFEQYSKLASLAFNAGQRFWKRVPQNAHVGTLD